MPKVQHHRGETPRLAGDTGAQQAQGEIRLLEAMAGIGVVEAVDQVDVGEPDCEIACLHLLPLLRVAVLPPDDGRSDEGSVGQGCGSGCKSQCSTIHEKTTIN